ncbi:MAG: hypothetical protein J6N77_05630, partial [Lachnospiraceae bacterium]|nr:hypothetical protein [Lachnospiraceae bacterium]
MEALIRKIREFLQNKWRVRRLRRSVTALATLVIFVTTYALVLPAITLDQDTAETAAGVVVETLAPETEAPETEKETEPPETEKPAEDSASEEKAEEKAEEEPEAESTAGTAGIASVTAPASEGKEAAGEEKTPGEAAASEAGDVQGAETLANIEETAGPSAEPATAESTEETTPEVVIAAGKLEKELQDVVITVTFDKEAGIPEGTELFVEELTEKAKDYKDYVEKAEEVVQKKAEEKNENVETQVMRLFDIKLLYNNEKIDLNDKVQVKIAYKKPLQVSESLDVQAIHFADSEKEVKKLDVKDEKDIKILKTETKESGKTVTTDEGTTTEVEELKFDTDGFSVYAIVGTETISEQYIDAHGDTYKVTVTYSEDAQIPEGAKLSVTEISEDSNEYQEFYSKAAEAVLDGQEKAVPFARFFDISIMDGEEEIQPQAPVDVKIEFIGNVETQSGARFNAVHFAENSIDVMDASVQLAAEENHAVEAVSFEAEGFSVYGVTYTVDFTYKNYTFSIPGESSILLSELFEILGIEADVAEVTSVEFTDDDLIRIEQLESDWLLTSLMPFDTDELLTVTTRSGIVYRIDVQDDQDVTFPESIKASGGTYIKQGEVQSVTATYVLTGQGQTDILDKLGLYNTTINTDEIYCTLYYQAYRHSQYSNDIVYLLEIRALDEVLAGSGYSIDNDSLWDIYTPSGNNDIDSSTARYPQTGNPASAQSTKTIAYLKNTSYTHRRALALVFSRPVSGRYNYQLFGSGSKPLVVYKVIEVTYTDGEANGQAFTPDQVYSQRSQINGSTGAWSSVNMPAFVAADGTHTPSWTDHTFTGWKVTASEDENIPV